MRIIFLLIAFSANIATAGSLVEWATQGIVDGMKKELDEDVLRPKIIFTSEAVDIHGEEKWIYEYRLAENRWVNDRRIYLKGAHGNYSVELLSSENRNPQLENSFPLKIRVIGEQAQLHDRLGNPTECVKYSLEFILGFGGSTHWVHPDNALIKAFVKNTRSGVLVASFSLPRPPSMNTPRTSTPGSCR